jgi:predicted Ser/Thr protein kinase
MDMSTSMRIASLAGTARREVESWLERFQNGWNEKRLRKIVRQLPREHDPRRLPALLGIVAIDLQLHWQNGHKVRIESYLKAFPELTTADVVPDLIEAEIAARRKAGARADLASFAERFPEQIEYLGAIEQAASNLEVPATGSGRYSTRDTSPPVAIRFARQPSGLAIPMPPEQFGRYRILRKLGQGGMGTVYLAHDSQLDRRLALKVPHLSAPDCPRALERFYREARAAATLSHPNICQVYDVGTFEGVHFVTMAFVDGKPLSELMMSKNQFPQKSVAAIIRKLARAMQEAHTRGIVHRDLKPSNIMINLRSEPVIMDFGLAYRAQEKVRLTMSGAIVGTPGYMSPEQVRADSKAIGPASDVYSLGVILYEMLTGHLPFDGPVSAVFAKILTLDPPRPLTFRPDVDPVLEAICMRAMARELPDRHGSMKDLAADLTRYLKGEGGSVPPLAEATRGP